MSSDNFVGILRTLDGKGSFEYRVTHGQAIDNLTYQHEDGNPEMVASYFGNSKIYDDLNEAMKLATKIEKEVGYVEYGITMINLPHPFSYFIRKHKEKK